MSLERNFHTKQHNGTSKGTEKDCFVWCENRLANRQCFTETKIFYKELVYTAWHEGMQRWQRQLTQIRAEK